MSSGWWGEFSRALIFGHPRTDADGFPVGSSVPALREAARGRSTFVPEKLRLRRIDRPVGSHYLVEYDGESIGLVFQAFDVSTNPWFAETYSGFIAEGFTSQDMAVGFLLTAMGAVEMRRRRS